MKKTELLSLLENLCHQLAIFVKYDVFFGKGGYCRLRDKAYFIINQRLSNEAKEQIFINELKSFNLTPTSVPEKLKHIFKKE